MAEGKLNEGAPPKRRLKSIIRHPGAHTEVRLSPRETQVLKLICDERDTHAIAVKLGITPRTVANYRFSIYKKIGVHTPIGMIRWALRKKIIKL